MNHHKLPSKLPKPLDPGHKISDKYVLGSEIGRGAFGTVYECQNTKTGETVAAKRISVKDLNADQLNALEEEVSLLKNLNHPNIVKYIGTVRTRNHLHILLEYMENGSLSQNIKRFGVFSPELVALFTRQVLQGLAYLHDQGVIHRDIKGANILTTKSGRVKLADFGVATHVSKVARSNASNDASGNGTHDKGVNDSETESHSTNDTLPDNAVVGTPYWMAPEVIEMLGASTACDIWSVGCTVLELLTGKPPYFDVPPMAALYRIVQDEAVPLPPNLDADLLDFLRKCFVKTPALRATAVELLEHPWIDQSRKNQLGNPRGSFGEESEELVRRASLTGKPAPNPKTSTTTTTSAAGSVSESSKANPAASTAVASSSQQQIATQKKSSVQLPKPKEKDSNTVANGNSSAAADYDSDNKESNGNLQPSNLMQGRSTGVGLNRNSANMRTSLLASDSLTVNSESSASSSQSSHNILGGHETRLSRPNAPRNSLPGEVYDSVHLSNYPEISEADRRSWHAKSIAEPNAPNNAASKDTTTKTEGTKTSVTSRANPNNNNEKVSAVTLNVSSSPSSPVASEVDKNKAEPQEEVVEDWDIEFGFNIQEGADSNLGLGQTYTGPIRVNKLSSPSKSDIDSIPGVQAGQSNLNMPGTGNANASGSGQASSSTSNSIAQLQPAQLRALKGSGSSSLSSRIAGNPSRSHHGPLALPSNRYRPTQRAFKPMSPLVEVQILGLGQMDSIDLDTVFEGDAPYGESGAKQNFGDVSSSRSLISQHSEHVIRSANSVEFDRKGSDPQVPFTTNQGPLARYRESDLDSDFHKINLNSNNSPATKTSTNSKNVSSNSTGVAPQSTNSIGRRGSTSNKKTVSKRASIEEDANVANELRRRLSKLPQNSSQSPTASGASGVDPFSSPAFENEQKSGSVSDDIRDEENLPKRVNEVLQLVSQLRPSTPNEDGIVQACNQLCDMFEEQPKLRKTLLTHHGIIPIMEALEFEAKNPRTTQAVLKLVANVSEGDRSMQEVIAMAGIIPMVVIHSRPEMEMETRLYAAEIVKQFIESSGTTLQMFVACGGLPVFANLLQPQMHQQQEMNARQRMSQTISTSTPDVGLALVALNGIRRVFRLSDASIALPPLVLPRQRLANNEKRKSSGARHGAPKPAAKQVSFKPTLNTNAFSNREDLSDKPYVRTIPRNDVCRLFIRTGLLDRVAILLDHIRTPKGEKECLDADISPIRLIKETASVLLVFSLGNTYVKQHLASAKIMRSIILALADLWGRAKENTKAEREAETAKTLLKCIKNLCIEQTTLDVLESAGAIQVLVSCLTVSVGGTYMGNSNVGNNGIPEHEARPSVPGVLGSSLLGISSPGASKKRTTIAESNSKKSSQVESTLTAVALPKKGSLTSKSQKG